MTLQYSIQYGPYIHIDGAVCTVLCGRSLFILTLTHEQLDTITSRVLKWATEVGESNNGDLIHLVLVPEAIVSLLQHSMGETREAAATMLCSRRWSTTKEQADVQAKETRRLLAMTTGDRGSDDEM